MNRQQKATAVDACLHAGMSPADARAAVAVWAKHGGDGCSECELVATCLIAADHGKDA